MAFCYTRSRTRRSDDDVEPDGISSDPLLDTTFVRPQVEATGGSEPMLAEPAEPVSAPIHLPVGLPLRADPVYQNLPTLLLWGFPWDTPVVKQVRSRWKPKLRDQC